MLSDRGAARGFTLVELLVTMVVFGILAAGVMRVTIHQQRFAEGVRQAMSARHAVRDAAEVLRTELRGAAPSDGGISVIAPDRIEFRAPLGVSVICDIDAARSAATIPAPSPLTAWVTTPQRGDTVLVYEWADPPESGRWHPHALADAPQPGASCPAASGLGSAGGLVLHLVPALAPPVAPGAPLRFVRRAEFRFYRAGDDLWYLGYRDCLATRATPCAEIQPVSGPFTSGGIHFAYRGSTGAPTSDPADVALIELQARAARPAPVSPGGFGRGFVADSLAVAIALRNR